MAKLQNIIDSSKAFWIFSLLFWGCSFWFGVPVSNVDDPFFVGTSVQLATTGEYYNPLISDWMQNNGFRTDHYLVHFPIFFYGLAFWFKCFGVGATQTSLLFCLAGFFSSMAGWRIFRFLKTPPLLPWFFVLVVYFVIQQGGFRPDGLALAFLTGGLAFLTLAVSCSPPSCKTIPIAMVAFGAAACGATIWPIAGVTAIPFFLLVFFLVPGPSLNWPKLALGAGLGLLVAIVIVVLLVKGEILLFWREYSQHVRVNSIAGFWGKIVNFGQVWNICFYSPLFANGGRVVFLLLALVSAFAGALLFRLPQSTVVRKFSTASLVAAILIPFFYPRMIMLLIPLLFLVWAAVLSQIAESFRTFLIPVALLFLLLVLQTIQSQYSHSRFIQEEKARFGGLHLNPSLRVIYDEFIYRYYYNLQPPPLSKPWLTWTGTFYGGDLSTKKTEDIWFVKGSKIHAQDDRWTVVYPAAQP